MQQLTSLLFLLASTAPAMCAAPAPAPPSGPCSLHTSLNRIYWVTQDELRGHGEPVLWHNEVTGTELYAVSDEGGYIHQTIPNEWIDALTHGRVTQLDGSRKLSRRLYSQTICLACATGTWGRCSAHSVDMLPVQAAP